MEWVALAAAVAVPLAIATLWRLFPTPTVLESAPPVEALRAQYRNWDLMFGICAVALWIVLGGVLRFSLRRLATFHGSLGSQAEIVWVAGQGYWRVVAMLLATTATIPLLNGIGARLLQGRYTEYTAYTTALFKIDVLRLARAFLATGAAICAVLVYCGVAWYVRLDSDGLTVHRFFSLASERHAFDEVTGIVTAPTVVAPNGNLVVRREYLISFTNGRSWSTNNLVAEPSAEEKKRFVEILAARSGVSLREVESLDTKDL